jgi:hypothetical protein
MKDIIDTTVVQPAKDAVRRLFQALKDLGHNALDVLKAPFEIEASAAALAFTPIQSGFRVVIARSSIPRGSQTQKVFGGSAAPDRTRRS